MTLEALVMILIWTTTLITALALLSSITHPDCGTHGRGRHCNIHNGAGEWK